MTVALVGALVTCVLLFLDLFTKGLADVFLKHLEGANDTPYFLNIIRWNYVQNDGIAWSSFGKSPIVMFVITALTGVMIVAIGVLFFTYFKKNTPARMALAVIEAGAIGNFVDRVVRGGLVRDFINIRFLLPEYTCNFADMCVVLGAIALIVIILFIGPHSAFPITKKWREEAKKLEEAEKKGKKGKKKS